ncbi:MAG: hypothetical protein IKF82_06385 [Bacilli bacterium]|nr:hypothetical protein [Bacilli bacterium]MBR3209877.1 hypothetical protein [Bacilli bacterium]
MLTRRNFIKAAIFTTAAIPVAGLLSGCEAPDQTNFTYDALDDFYIMTYIVNGQNENMILTIGRSDNSCYQYKVDVEREQLSGGNAICIYWKIDEYFNVVEIERILKPLIEKYGYKDSYSIEEINEVVNTYNKDSKEKTR